MLGDAALVCVLLQSGGLCNKKKEKKRFILQIK